MAEVYSSVVKNYIQRNGFVMVSNLLLDFQDELGITEGELVFIIKILRNKTNLSIHDEELDSSVSSRTLSRRRNSLKEKGLLNFSVLKKQNENGKFQTAGISYDLSPLEKKLQELSDILESKKKSYIQQEITEQEIIVEDNEENSPLIEYQKEYEDYYGVPYQFNKFEISKYNSLSDENKKLIAYIFEYCRANNLLDKIVPRLSLFFKTSFRFADLKKWYLNNNFETVEENEENWDVVYKYVDDWYRVYYTSGNRADNPNFYSMLFSYICKTYDHELNCVPNIKEQSRMMYERCKKYER